MWAFIARYWMPSSMTFWLGILLILTGLSLNLISLFGLDAAPVLALINMIWDVVPNDVSGLPDVDAVTIPPNVFVVAGLALLGIRRAQNPA